MLRTGRFGARLHDPAEGLLPVKAMLGFPVGGMGAASRDFHADPMVRMGYGQEARRVRKLFCPDGARQR